MLFGLLVRRNLKKHAELVFPDLTRVLHRRVVYTDAHSFGLFRGEGVVDQTERLMTPGSWSKFIERTRKPDTLPVPDGLAADVLTLGLFLILCPFRMNEEVTFFMDEKFLGNWHA
jgi:hypothetical protein